MTTPTPIPTTPSITESAVIRAPLASVWHLLKLASFPTFWTSLSSASPIPSSSSSSTSPSLSSNASPEVDLIRWVFKDGTTQDIKLEEHSSLDHYITYSVIASEPPLSYSGVISTVRCWGVTSGEFEGGTYVAWSGAFSGDADAGVIEDARFKRKEALADLAKKAVADSKK